jgi:thiol-disulfide isomerase/thioredoxin
VKRGAVALIALVLGCGEPASTEPALQPTPEVAAPAPAPAAPVRTAPEAGPASQAAPGARSAPRIERLPDPAGIADSATGLPNGVFAPELARPDLLSGGNFRLSRHVGPQAETATKAVVVGFVASWCGPCRASLPTLAALRKEHGDALQVVFVATDEDEAGRKKEAEHVRAAGLDAPVLDPQEDDLRAWLGRRRNVPHFYVINRVGQILVQDRGFGDKVRAVLPKQVAFALRSEGWVPR